MESSSCSRGCDGNGGTGIALVNSDDNLLARNDASENGRAGIFLDSKSTGNRLRDNVAANNTGIGINASDRSKDLGGNRAGGNGGPVQCRNVRCAPAA